MGSLEPAAPWEGYEYLGRRTREDILEALPQGWSFEGKAVLDFGCGAGRTLRHFMEEAQSCELWGCDIDAASIAWLDEHLSPPLHVFQNGPDPPLPHPDGTFDLIWAVSVFTHLTDTWSRWLLELRRVLADDGLLYVTFMGRGTCEDIAGEAWEDGNYGMNVLRNGQGWELGGPMVLHSPWWITAHWGRAFEISSLKPDGFAGDPGTGHGAVLMRRRPMDVTAAELEAIEPDEPREATALAHNLRQVLAEVADLRQAHELQRRELAEVQRRLQVVAGSRSWTLTRPLRLLAGAARSRRP